MFTLIKKSRLADLLTTLKDAQDEARRMRALVMKQKEHIEKLTAGEVIKPGDPVALRIGRDFYGDMIYLSQLPLSSLHQCAYLDSGGQFQTVDLPFAALKRIAE